MKVRVGLVLGVVYAVTAVGYVRIGDMARPLFDGFAPPPPYRWVNPPREFRAGNQPPRPSTLDLALTPEGSVVGGGSSEDGQVILSMGAGAVPPHPPDSKVSVLITPVDPRVLAPAPPGLTSDGNAYRVDFTYQPSGQPVTALALPADIFVVVPEPAQTLLFSPDGRAWDSLPFRPVPDPSQIAGAFTGPGYFLAVAPPVGRPSESGSDDSTDIVTAVAATIGLAILLWGLPASWQRLRKENA